VVAIGTGPITYQWYKGSLGSPISGGTSSTLTFGNPQLSDNGTYFVVATGPGAGNFQQSTNVTVTVNQDSTSPDVVSAIAVINGTQYNSDFLGANVCPDHRKPG